MLTKYFERPFKVECLEVLKPPFKIGDIYTAIGEGMWGKEKYYVLEVDDGKKTRRMCSMQSNYKEVSGEVSGESSESYEEGE